MSAEEIVKFAFEGRDHYGVVRGRFDRFTMIEIRRPVRRDGEPGVVAFEEPGDEVVNIFVPTLELRAFRMVASEHSGALRAATPAPPRPSAEAPVVGTAPTIAAAARRA